MQAILDRTVGSGPIKNSQRNAEDKQQRFIQHFQDENLRLPKRNELTSLLRIGRDTATRSLSRFNRDQERVSVQTAYIEYFNSCVRSARQRVLDQSEENNSLKNRDLHPLLNLMSPDLRALLNQATYCLYGKSPLVLMTVRVPSDSEIAYLAVCDNSDNIPNSLISALMPDDQAPLFLYRWEPDRSGKRVHLHLLLHYPRNLRLHSLKAKLKRVWYEVLDNLDTQTFCDPFVDDDGINLRYRGSWVDVIPYEELKPNKYTGTYLGKRKYSAAEGGAYMPQYFRLEILNGAKVSPVSHGGVSKALRDLVREETFTVQISCDTPEGIERQMWRLKDFMPLPDERGKWADHFLKYDSQKRKIGERCRYMPNQMPMAIEKLRMIASENHDPDRIKTEWTLKITISPDRFCTVIITHHVKREIKHHLAREASNQTLHELGRGVFSGSEKKTVLTSKNAINALTYFFWCGDDLLDQPPIDSSLRLISRTIDFLKARGITLNLTLLELITRASEGARYRGEKS